MNRNKLKTFAPKARRDFIAAVSARAIKFGVSRDNIEPVQVQGDVALIAGQAHPKKVAEQRAKLESRIKIRGFEQVMEEAAYTWFNRFAAIRYMEVHGYLDHGYRVLSHPEGKPIPEIVEHAQHLDLPGLDMEKVIELKLDGTKEGELYRMLLLAQCNALHAAMPFLFERINDETELLLPDNLLHSDSVIRQMVNEIEEADWQEIEIIGWLYQFYISEKKDQVIGSVVRSEDIPAATQLFTPNWIVKYMVQNTLGAKWLATYPQSGIRVNMEFYIEPAEQPDEVNAKLAAITPKELAPEEITFLDPACGSGHILVEAYDLFRDIYLERGYVLRDVPRLILKKNLFGLDIDDRAAQMAAFALLMKARADDRRIFDRSICMNVLAIQESKGLDVKEICRILVPDERFELVPSYDLLPDTLPQPTLAKRSGGAVAKAIQELVSLFADGKVFGSLITIPSGLNRIKSELSKLSKAATESDHTIGGVIESGAINDLNMIATQSAILCREYDCVVANPPYMGEKFFQPALKEFAKNKYRESRSDLYGCFLHRSLTLAKQNGYVSLITIPNWMFLSSFEDLRSFINGCSHINSLVHNGRGVFGSDFGSCSFTLRKRIDQQYRGTYKRLFEKQGSVSSNDELSSRFGASENYTIAAEAFSHVPGTPISYWVPDRHLSLFSDGPALGEIAPAKIGMRTGDNKRFLRLWWEIATSEMCISANTALEAKSSGKKWFPYNKGGEFRRWYGNRDFVVNWLNDGLEVKESTLEKYPQLSWDNLGWKISNESYFFKECVTWSFVSSSYFGVRYSPPGSIFDVGGSSAFPSHQDAKLVIAYLCSSAAFYFMRALNPTLNFQVSNVAALPWRMPAEPIRRQLESLADRAISASKLEWDSVERSWDFSSLDILESNSSLTEHWLSCRNDDAKGALNEIAECERLIDEIFAEVFDIDVHPEDKSGDECGVGAKIQINDLISYCVGCMMGRYSLDEPGLIYADSGNIGFDPNRYTTFQADDDGIIPIMQTDWFEDDATNRFVEFIKVAWSPATLNENLKFVADSLGAKNGETPIDTIRRYLSTDFFKDHLKTYKRRPIYWLFSSGKEKAFEALVYLHRYNEGTLSRMRMEYVTPLQGRISSRIDQLGRDIDTAASTAAQNKLRKEQEKLKKQQAELIKFDEELRHRADMRINLDLDDGVRVNYGKFGNLLAEVKAITGGSDE